MESPTPTLPDHPAITSRPVGDGYDWLKQGFGLFRRDIGIWIALLVIYLIITTVIALIPIVSLATILIGPLFTAGFMIAARRADSGENIALSDLFAGFRERTGPLVQLALIQFGLYVLVGLAAVVLVLMTGDSLQIDRDTMSPGQMPLTVLLVVLVVAALAIPVAMGMYYAPALVMLNGLRPWAAFKLSLAGCLRNIMPLLWFGILGTLLAVLASLPLMLGWLVLIPVLFAANYCGYKAIFIAAGDDHGYHQPF